MTPSLLPPPPPSSPIPQAQNEDSRLAAFIRSRIRNRPAQRVKFEQALSLLIDAGMGFSDLPSLSSVEWRVMGISRGTEIDLLKNDKIWHLQNPDSVGEVEEAAANELDDMYN